MGRCSTKRDLSAHKERAPIKIFFFPARGAPVNLTQPLSPENLNASERAKLFLNWCMSKEGQIHDPEFWAPDNRLQVPPV